MSTTVSHRRAALGAALVTTVAAATAWGGLALHSPSHSSQPSISERLVEKLKPVQGDAGDESHEAATAADEYAQARTAPGGIVNPGAYSAAWSSLQSLPTSGGAWTEETTAPYNSDDPNYREYYHSNSSGGAGFVSGRVTGLATIAGGGTGGADAVFAGGADGGVFRSLDGGRTWTPITSSLPTLSTGDLEIGPDGALWYATGEANTGGTSYVGTGVYRLADPTTSTSWQQVGGTELESTSINKVRFDAAGNAFAATFRGIWRHAASAPASAPWQLVYAPNPDYLPGGSKASAPLAGYKNMVNDLAIKGSTLIANIAWRGGDTYNGFYQSTKGGLAGTWSKVNPTGALKDVGIGNAEFAYAADGSHLYAVVESTTRYAHTANTVLDGIYDSPSGSVAGPWNKIADSQKLAGSGSALKLDRGYRPGIQAWYNNSIAVDPSDPKHLFVGLEEVFETRDAGVHWTAVAPYWNFSFDCWSYDDTQNTCSKAPHSDQHALAISGGRVYIGNDGGIYARRMDAGYDQYGHGLGWQELNPGLDTLQYYSVGVGTDSSGARTISGGLQDNGQSLYIDGSPTMVSPFGGDGGITLVDPRPGQGCNIVAEYVFLSMAVTNNCGRSKGDPNESPRVIRDIAPADPSPRFIAPFDDDGTNPDHWIAGGRYVWTQDQGYAIQDASAWKNVFDNGAGHSTTALALQGGVGWTAWCGPCGESGFTRGVSTNAGGTWHQVTLPADVPNRYVSGVTVDPADPSGNTVYLAFNGFSRKFTEGPGAGYGHLWKTTDGGTTWTQVGAGTLPDVPADSLVITPTGALVLGTDLGVVYSTDGGSTWQRLGGNFPATTVMQVLLGPDGRVYAATHGRGIWSIPVPTA